MDILWIYYATNCGIPLVNRNVALFYNSTPEGSRSVLSPICESDITSLTVTVTCHSSGKWIPDPTQLVQVQKINTDPFILAHIVHEVTKY